MEGNVAYNPTAPVHRWEDAAGLDLHLQLTGERVESRYPTPRAVCVPIFLPYYTRCRSAGNELRSVVCEFAGKDKAVTANYAGETINWPTRGL